jgi:GWxTD domain-containing protein
MRIKFFAGIFCIVLFTILCQGCSASFMEKRAMSYKQHVENDMYMVLTSDQYSELDNQTTDNDINIFVDRFWKEQGTELRNEYNKRVKYANLHFPDQYGWGRSDRKRIYIKYGPPLEINRTNFADIALGSLAKIKSVEVWYYGHPGKNNSMPTKFTQDSKGEMKFVFADMIGSGFYKIVDSTEDPGDIDSRIFNSDPDGY